LDALDIFLAFEVVEVFGFLPPALLALGFTNLAALGLGTVALTPHVAVVGMKETFTVQTFTLAGWVCHRPESPQAYDVEMAVWKEENRQYKWHEEEEGRRSKKGIDIKFWRRRRNGLTYNFDLAAQ
jgi:hypothetical protein